MKLSSLFSTRTFALLGMAATVTLASCGKDDDDAPIRPAYEVPATYNFENVNYSGQTTRLNMLTALTSYIRTGNNGAVLDEQKMKDMYRGSNFDDASLNNTGKQLYDKTFAIDQNLFDGFLEAVAEASTSAGAPATEGNAGILTTADGNKYLVDENGVEYNQLIAKGLMGAVFYYQSVSSYLTDSKIGPGVDNTTVKPGEGTTMEHHWDEAFGYFGAPKDFPANKTGLLYWANYSNKVDAVLKSNKALMDAFLKGRAAISNKDMAGKAAAAATVRHEWERLVAASAIHELNAAKKNFSDQAYKSHYLSEAAGFVLGLKYKGDRKITDAQMENVFDLIGDNYYQTTVADIDAAVNLLSSIYGMDSIKATL